MQPRSPTLLAQADAPKGDDAKKDDGRKDEPQKEPSPEEKMARRFPQKIRVGDLVGLPVIDDDYHDLGPVTEVVRTPQDKIRLIVQHGGLFGWFGRKVSVPIEVVAILGKQVASLDMPPPEYDKAPTWTAGADRRLPDDEIIRIALTKR